MDIQDNMSRLRSLDQFLKIFTVTVYIQIYVFMYILIADLNSRILFCSNHRKQLSLMCESRDIYRDHIYREYDDK